MHGHTLVTMCFFVKALTSGSQVILYEFAMSSFRRAQNLAETRLHAPCQSCAEDGARCPAQVTGRVGSLGLPGVVPANSQGVELAGHLWMLGPKWQKH